MSNRDAYDACLVWLRKRASWGAYNAMMSDGYDEACDYKDLLNMYQEKVKAESVSPAPQEVKEVLHRIILQLTKDCEEQYNRAEKAEMEYVSLREELYKVTKENERLSDHVGQLAFELGCEEKESHRHSHGRCLVTGLAKLEDRIKELEQATIDQYNAGRASTQGELDVATRAASDAHKLLEQQIAHFTEIASFKEAESISETLRANAAESSLAEARKALEKLAEYSEIHFRHYVWGSPDKNGLMHEVPQTHFTGLMKLIDEVKP